MLIFLIQKIIKLKMLTFEVPVNIWSYFYVCVIRKQK